MVEVSNVKLLSIWLKWWEGGSPFKIRVLGQDVPWNHGSDDDSSESLEWPDLEFWRPRWVGMSPSAIAHQIEQEAFQRIDQKVLHRIRHNKALKVRCTNQSHLDNLIEKIRGTNGNDAMHPEIGSASSNDEFW